MVDISQKVATARTAAAEATLHFPASMAKLLWPSSQEDYSLETVASKKGPVWSSATMSAILAAKATPSILPLCHPINLDRVSIAQVSGRATEAGGVRVVIRATVQCTGKTGVEMEALAAVQGASLAVYDMVKAISHELCIEDIRVVHKAGGKRLVQLSSEPSPSGAHAQ